MMANDERVLPNSTNQRTGGSLGILRSIHSHQSSNQRNSSGPSNGGGGESSNGSSTDSSLDDDLIFPIDDIDGVGNGSGSK
ncbi:hypothetical protein AAE478_008347 [Parahypoxylon ruwenzoriense]